MESFAEGSIHQNMRNEGMRDEKNKCDFNGDGNDFGDVLFCARASKCGRK